MILVTKTVCVCVCCFFPDSKPTSPSYRGPTQAKPPQRLLSSVQLHNAFCLQWNPTTDSGHRTAQGHEPNLTITYKSLRPRQHLIQTLFRHYLLFCRVVPTRTIYRASREIPEIFFSSDRPGCAGPFLLCCFLLCCFCCCCFRGFSFASTRMQPLSNLSPGGPLLHGLGPSNSVFPDRFVDGALPE